MKQAEDLSTAPRAVLTTVWEASYGVPPPSRLARDMMASILMCDQQWERCGQSKASILRKLRKVAQSNTPNRTCAPAGSRLVREWNGREHIVDVMPDGYHWNGKAWRSLSAIAKEITGTKWSGPRFFGVTA